VTKKPMTQSTENQAGIVHPGMMGDGTEEQNLNERGNPSTRIKKDEVDAAFGRGTESTPVSNKPDELTAKAKEYENLAETVVDPQEKKKLEDLARDCRNLALVAQ
jgi:hypothetical protein